HAARVDGDRHAVRSIAFDHRCHDVGAPDSQGTDDDPVHDVEPALGVLHAAHPATDLDAGFDGAGDGCDDSGVGSAFEGGVEVDEVQPAGAEAGPVPGGVKRVGEVDRLAFRVAFVEPHGPASLHVYRRDDQEHQGVSISPWYSCWPWTSPGRWDSMNASSPVLVMSLRTGLPEASNSPSVPKRTLPAISERTVSTASSMASRS